MARKPGPLLSMTVGDWIYFTHDVNVGFFTSDGTVTSLRQTGILVMFYIETVSLQPYLLYANDGLDCSVMFLDFLMISQQTRYFRPAVRFERVSGCHPTGSVLEVDLPLPGFIRSAGTREYRRLMLWNSGS